MDGCTSDNQISSVEFWDSKSFFLAEINRLNQQKIGLSKELVFNETFQKMELKKVTWDKELNIFVELDLKRNGYKGRFDIDTLRINDTTNKVSYKANDAKLDLREVSLVYNSHTNKVISVEAIYNERSTIYNASKKYDYIVNEQFKIEGKQEVKFGKNATYSIIGTMLLPILNQRPQP